ncbi:MAG: hypothetical protein ABS976_04330, partial [Rhodococcus sp. (in: high G+C Gram-positive bacteria)]
MNCADKSRAQIRGQALGGRGGKLSVCDRSIDESADEFHPLTERGWGGIETCFHGEPEAGSGQGIGHDLAVYMASEGCKVVTNNRKPGSTMQTHDGKVVKLLPEDEAR